MNITPTKLLINYFINKRFYLIVLVMFFCIIFYGCGQLREIQMSAPSSAAATNEVVIVSCNIPLTIGNASAQKMDIMSVTDNSIALVIPSINVSMPGILDYSLAGSLTFPTVSLTEIQSTTPLTLNLTFNDILPYSSVVIRVKTLNSGSVLQEGLIGNLNGNVRLPFKIKLPSQTKIIIPNSPSYITYRQYAVDPQNPAVIIDTMAIYFSINFSNAVKQSYQTVLSIEVIGIKSP